MLMSSIIYNILIGCFFFLYKSSRFRQIVAAYTLSTPCLRGSAEIYDTYIFAQELHPTALMVSIWSEMISNVCLFAECKEHDVIEQYTVAFGIACQI